MNVHTQIHPTQTQGSYTRLRTLLGIGLVLLFLYLPWLNINGRQALLVDFVHGRFFFFGVGFWSHDAPMFFFIPAIAAATLAFVTCIWGRIWCGWACPQTVFIEQVFRKLETWIEGDAVKRRQLDKMPWLNEEKIFKRTIKWIVFLAVSLVISHSFIAYFLGTHALGQFVKSPPTENWGSFVFMSLVTGGVLFNFGCFREQICTSLCPYGRFQSVLMDAQSMTITYLVQRGEPRRNPNLTQQTNGDCIDCGKCVAVCPTGIDIRNGIQLECVACTACIDTCNTVMDKVRKPRNLIGYRFGIDDKRQMWARPMLYFLVLCFLLTSLVYILNHRPPVEIQFVRAIGTPYEQIIRPGQELQISNRFNVFLKNQLFEPVKTQFDSTLEFNIVSSKLPLILAAGEGTGIEVFVKFSQNKVIAGHVLVRLKYSLKRLETQSDTSLEHEVLLVGPLH